MRPAGVWVAVEPLARSTNTEKLSGDLNLALRERLGIAVVGTTLEPGSVPRIEVGKGRRLVRRTADRPIAGLD
jgi:phenylacetate-CoA ligase